MLQALGLDSVSERVYRAMLAHPDDDVVRLAARLDLPPGDLVPALDRLSELSLVYPDARESEVPRVVRPEAAMGILLARQEAALAAQQERTETARAAAARLVAEYASAHPDTGGDAVERLHGIATIRRRLALLGDSAQRSVMTFAPGGGHSEEDLQASRGPNEAMLARGVRIRTVYLDSVRGHGPTRGHVEWLGRCGAQVRTVPSLPLRMIIVDRETAVLPLDVADARDAAVVLREPSLLVALCALFDQTWAVARPFADPQAGGPATAGEELSRREREVLRLLAEGHTDESMAKRLGISSRSARRIVAGLLRRLDARSRFEAGILAVLAGWLPYGVPLRLGPDAVPAARTAPDGTAVAVATGPAPRPRARLAGG
ncbi:LuxR C-terminal-related transcriptional regulator [Streptomyces sp. DH12]|uniref:LuxR C-terminal-related transcriptional regulator n=1 Tax=Streptomyces sp. DH12 TaxID=2857010 RepID=UPI001E2E9B6E|nr:LuxR C-terminal-related transcriptional regulator [Streptomyces sp. DH12]